MSDKYAVIKYFCEKAHLFPQFYYATNIRIKGTRVRNRGILLEFFFLN